MSNLSEVNGFYHFVVYVNAHQGSFPEYSCKSFMWLCANEISEVSDIDTFVENWHKSNSKLPLYRFLGISKDEYALFVKDPDSLHRMIDLRKPQGRVTAFYVASPTHVFFSLAFCSPEDVKIGKFSRKEGRSKAIERFYGFGKEGVMRIAIDKSQTELSPFDLISLEIRAIINKQSVQEVKVGYETKYDDGRYVLISSPNVEVTGTIKIPNWLINPDNEIKKTVKGE